MPDERFGGSDDLLDRIAGEEVVDGVQTTYMRFKRRLSSADCWDHSISKRVDLILAWGNDLANPEHSPALPSPGDFYALDVVRYHGSKNRYWQVTDMLENAVRDVGEKTCEASSLAPRFDCQQSVGSALSGGTVHWSVMGSDGATVKLGFHVQPATLNGPYVAFGYSPQGGMIGAEVLIGGGNLEVPKAFSLNEKTKSGVKEVMKAEWSEIGYEAVEGGVLLEYKRPMPGDGGATSFVWALGSSNGELEYHNARGAIELDLSGAVRVDDGDEVSVDGDEKGKSVEHDHDGHEHDLHGHLSEGAVAALIIAILVTLVIVAGGVWAVQRKVTRERMERENVQLENKKVQEEEQKVVQRKKRNSRKTKIKKKK